MKKTNYIVRRALFDTGLYLYELGDLLGKSVPTMTRYMRKEQPEEVQEEWARLIREEAERRAKA